MQLYQKGLCFVVIRMVVLNLARGFIAIATAISEQDVKLLLVTIVRLAGTARLTRPMVIIYGIAERKS